MPGLQEVWAWAPPRATFFSHLSALGCLGKTYQFIYYSKITEKFSFVRAIDILPENIPDGIKEKILETAQNRKQPEITGGL